MIECCNEKVDSNMCIQFLLMLYKDWMKMKKLHCDFDKKFVEYLDKLNQPLDKGHLFLTSKTNCKGNKSPY